MQDQALAQEIAQVIYDKKGRDIVVLNVQFRIFITLVRHAVSLRLNVLKIFALNISV